MARSLATFVLTSCFFITVLPAAAQSQSDQAVSSKAASDKAAPLCIYSSKTYSDGAFVCAQKSLMLKCGVDGAKATWAVVSDKELSDRCQAPSMRGTVYQQRARWYRRNIRREITPAADTSAKCFNFNGKRYCE